MSKELAFIGDLHGDLRAINDFIEERPYVKRIIQVGDLGAYYSEDIARRDGDWNKHRGNVQEVLQYKPKMNRRVYFIKGNHEHFQMLESPLLFDLNISYIAQSSVKTILGHTIAFLGGIFSPKQIEKSSTELLGRNKRFYTREEIENLEKACFNKQIDILVTHEGPAGYIDVPEFPNNKGTQVIKDIVKKISPTYHIHGHHHHNYEAQYRGTKIIGLGNFSSNKHSFKLI